MVYQDLLYWINKGVSQGKFSNATECEQYIRNAQNGILYPSQEEAILYVFGEVIEEQPIAREPTEAPTVLEAIQRADVNIQEEQAEAGQPPITPEEHENVMTRLYRRLRGLFGGEE